MKIADTSFKEGREKRGLWFLKKIGESSKMDIWWWWFFVWNDWLMKGTKLYVQLNHFQRPPHCLTTNPQKWSDTLKQFAGCCRQIVWVCLTILFGWHDYFVGLAVKGLKSGSEQDLNLPRTWDQTLLNEIV